MKWYINNFYSIYIYIYIYIYINVFNCCCSSNNHGASFNPFWICPCFLNPHPPPPHTHTDLLSMLT